MIDRKARDLLAEQLRHLVSGLITNDDFEEAVFSVETDDQGYWAVADESWTLYSDWYQHKLTGSHALSKGSKRAVCVFILFLHSDLEYEWSIHPCTGFVRLLAGIISLGQIPKYFDERWKTQGDYNVYPFFRRSDFEKANANPKLLTGNKRVQTLG